MLPIFPRSYSIPAKKEIVFFVLHSTCRNFAPHFTENATWTRSSMDRIKDSGSFDWGSTPHGFTNILIQLFENQIIGFFILKRLSVIDDLLTSKNSLTREELLCTFNGGVALTGNDVGI